MSIQHTRIRKAADYLKMIAHPTRAEMIWLLQGKKALTVTKMCERLGMEQSLVSHHLALLRRHGLLKAKRDGIYISYSIQDDKVLEVLHLAMRPLAEKP